MSQPLRMTPVSECNYNYTYYLSIEKDYFDYDGYIEWNKENWVYVNHTIAVYLIIIFTGQLLMKSRPAFKLRRSLFAWNLFLAIFSTWGMVRSVPELYYSLKNEGIHDSICKYPYSHGIYGLWGFLYMASKFIELGDTFFVVLRKQKLIFLHWYHHITVLFGVCFTNVRSLSTYRYYITANYTVHAIMYSYFALKALGFRIPTRIMIAITSLQIIQMIIGVSTTTYAGIMYLKGVPCQVHPINVIFVLACYGSYFILFSNFFIQTYLKPKSNRSMDQNQNKLNAKKFQ